MSAAESKGLGSSWRRGFDGLHRGGGGDKGRSRLARPAACAKEAGMIEVRRLPLPGLCEIVPPKFGDARGFFSEVYNHAALAAQGVGTVFVQDNHSFSAEAGVLRGLH